MIKETKKMSGLSTPIGLVLLCACLGVIWASNAHALETRGGDEVYVSEKINDDLLLGGTDVKFDGEIHGDVIAAGMDIVVDGTVDGNINAAGYTVKAGGLVYRSVRLAGYKVTADGRIGNNLMLMGGIARVGSTCEVQNDVFISSGKAFVHGTVLGNLQIEADEVVISGTVDRDVDISAGKVTIDRSAVILGNLTYSSPEKATIADGAQIEGDTKYKKKTAGDTEDSFSSFFETAILFVGAYIVGLFLIGFCRRPCCSTRDIILSDLPRSFGFGLVLFIVVPIALVLALVTVIGIPVGVVALLLYVILFYVSKLFVALAIGDKLLSTLSSSPGPKSQALALLIGLVVLTILFNLPYIGWMLYLLTVMVGLGSILMAFNRCRKAKPEPEKIYITDLPSAPGAGGL
ncbi:MAG: polymer-forming cytoskeletal protein [Candidatus Zixiibacteriota bacterium]